MEEAWGDRKVTGRKEVETHRCRHRFQSVLLKKVQRNGVVAGGDSRLFFLIMEITAYLLCHEGDAVERGKLMSEGTCWSPCPQQENKALGALVEAWGGWELRLIVLGRGGGLHFWNPCFLGKQEGRSAAEGEGVRLGVRGLRMVIRRAGKEWPRRKGRDGQAEPGLEVMHLKCPQ